MFVATSATAKVAVLPGFEGAPAVSNGELAQMRGGMRLGNGVIVNFALEFRTIIDGVAQPPRSFTEADLMGNTGVINTVVIDPGSHQVTAQTTNAMHGVMTIIQNNASGIAIQNTATLTADFYNLNLAVQSVRESNMASRIAFAAAQGLR